jgi:hypothetical protein
MRIASQLRLQPVFAEKLRLRVMLGLSRSHDEKLDDADNTAVYAAAAYDNVMQKEAATKTKRRASACSESGASRCVSRCWPFNLVAGRNLHAWGDSGGSDGNVANAEEIGAGAERFSAYAARAEPKKKLGVSGATTTSTTERHSSGNADELAHNNNDNDSDNADNSNKNINNIVRQQEHQPKRPPRFSLAGRASVRIPFGVGRHTLPQPAHRQARNHRHVCRAMWRV